MRNMKKILNDPFKYVDEMLEGMCLAHPELYRQTGESGRVIVRASDTGEGKVGIVSGGGSGHLPIFTGYVGKGLLDACAIGDVFASPSVEQMADAMRAADAGAGVLRLYGNYGGDIMNFEMAADMIDHANQTVIVNDDVAVEDSTYTTGRRGVAGTMIVEKTIGSLAETGASLDECKNFGDHVNNMTASMGVAFSSCTVPAAGKPTFELSLVIPVITESLSVTPLISS